MMLLFVHLYLFLVHFLNLLMHGNASIFYLFSSSCSLNDFQKYPVQSKYLNLDLLRFYTTFMVNNFNPGSPKLLYSPSECLIFAFTIQTTQFWAENMSLIFTVQQDKLSRRCRSFSDHLESLKSFSLEGKIVTVTFSFHSDLSFDCPPSLEAEAVLGVRASFLSVLL